MKVPPELRLRFQEYVRDVAHARQNLEFLLDNLGIKTGLDYSRGSLEALEEVFWRAKEIGIPPELSDELQFAQLMTQYLADTIVRSTGAKWEQVTDANPMFGQPSLDGFGNKNWDRIYPVQLANQFVSLRSSNPEFPGVKERRVLARMYDKAMKLYLANNSP